MSIAFAPTNDKMLVTLTDYTNEQQSIHTWQWDKTKAGGNQTLSNTSGGYGTHISFCNTDEKSIVVTGPNLFKYYKIVNDGNMKSVGTGLAKKEQHISSIYTAHCWLPDNKILVGTD